MATIFKIRRDTATNWSSNNPTLADGELGLDKTNTYLKVGDGSTAWNSLGQFTQTQESVEDHIGGMVTGNTETFITVTYDDSDGTLDFVVPVLDEDDMASDSASHLATQQSIKNYVDNTISLEDLDIQGDSGGALSIDLNSETLTIAGGTGLDTSGTGNTITVAIDSTVTTLTGSQTLTNKTLTAPTLTSPVLNTGVSGSAVLDEDNMASNSATKLATQQSIKAYVDAQVDTADALSELADTTITTPADGSLLLYDTGNSVWIDNVMSGDATLADTGAVTLATVNSNVGSFGGATAIPVLTVNAKGLVTAASTASITTTLTVGADSGSNDTVALASDTLDFSGGTGIDTTVSDNDISIAIDGTVTTLAGSQTLTNKTLTTPVIASLKPNGSTTLTMPAATDQLVGRATTDTLTNKSIDLGDNTLTGSLAEFNAALQSESFVSLTGSETLTNKTLTTPTITSATLNTGVSGSAVLDEDDMSSNSATQLATQQSIKAYVDTTVTAQDLDIAGDSGTGAIDLDSETLTIAGTANEVTTAMSGNTLTVGLPTNVTIAGNLTVSGTQTTVSSTTVNVADPMLSLATNNGSADAVDIGLYGLYDTSGSQDLYGGIFRDASDSGKWKLFKDSQAEPTTTVNTGATGHATGTLVANLEGNVTGNVVGNLTGNVTGNASGTALTVTQAAQTAITSVGTLTALQVDNININGNTISTTGGTDLNIGPVAGQQIVLDGAIVVDAGVVTGATSITSTGFTGALTGNADTATAWATGRTVGMTGDVVWTSASLTGAANVTGTATIQADAVEGSMIAADAIDSEHYAAGSIDLEHMSANSVDSDQYVDGSIDTVHIADDQVTYAKIQNVSATDRILGRDSSGAGVIEEITPANLRTMINVEDGADVTDATNVNAAGALMLSDTTTAGLGIVVDEDNMASNLDTKVPTQQSVKAYVDGQTTDETAEGSSNLYFTDERVDDRVNALIVGGTNVTATYDDANNRLTISAATGASGYNLSANDTDDLTEGSANLYFTNARADGRITAALIDEDNMASDSATRLPSQQSVKAYVDSQVTAQDLDLTTDDGTIAIDLDSETLTIAGGTGLSSSATGNTATLAIDGTVTTLTGSQTLTNKTLTSPVLNTGVSGTAIKDEDNMASDSATHLATQQSIKAYVDGQTTDETAEGSSNLYHTTARARAAISVTDAGGDGSCAYNSSTGVITYTGPSASEVRAHISGGTGVTVSSGEIAIGQAVATNSNVQFANIVATGNFTVNGTTTTVASTNTTHTDALIEYATGTTGTPANDAGIVIERGSSDNAFIGFDESADKFTVGTGSFTGASTGNLTITKGTLVADIEGDLTGSVTGAASLNLLKTGGALTGAVTTNSTFDGRDVAADGVTADAALPRTGGAMTGAITTNSTFDGRDVATDGTKLDGIEANATADQTAAEIVALVEAGTDSNTFTDADHSKLNAIEASADVTDATNVEAAGAVMESGNTASAKIPAGTTAQRDGSPSAGFFRWNTTETQAEIYDGSAWSLVGGGNTTEKALWEHSYTVAENYEVSSGNNALTAGPITINSSASVTIPSGSTWVVV